MNKLWLCRTVLLVAVLLSLCILAPLELAADFNSYFLTTTASVETILQSQFKLNLARQNCDYPGEFLLAANLVPVANYFCNALKQVNLNGVKTRDFKVIGKSPQLHLASATILLFYIFYQNSRTTCEEDPFNSDAIFNPKIRCV